MINQVKAVKLFFLVVGAVYCIAMHCVVVLYAMASF